MTGAAGSTGALQDRFEAGLRFLATALALQQDHRNGQATVTAACDAIGCFLVILAAAAERSLPDPEGEVATLRAQCEALLTPRQSAEDALRHAVQAALLARDQAARLLPLVLAKRD